MTSNNDNDETNKKRFTDELREAAGDGWTRVVNHRFTDELAAGTIDRTVLTHYLEQDHLFLDAFVILLSSMISNARSLSDRIPACQFLGLITGKENTYFQRALQELRSNDKKEVSPGPVTQDFLNIMTTTAKEGTLAEQLVILVVCEWSYCSWGERVLPQTDRTSFVTYEWVDLHSGPAFAQVVDYLRTLLDQEANHYLTEQEKESCRTLFLKVVGLEEAFFNNAYQHQK